MRGKRSAAGHQGAAAGEELPPVAVSCTGGGCGHQFLSRAERFTVVRCPRCKHPVRVKRPRPPGWQRKPRSSSPRPASPAKDVCRENPRTVITHAAPVLLPGPVSAAAGRLSHAEDGQDVADDGWAYIPDDAGRLVLADLTPDGHMLPIHLVDRRFRALVPGLCSVYGCLNPVQRMIRGWPVCLTCHRELAEMPGQ